MWASGSPGKNRDGKWLKQNLTSLLLIPHIVLLRVPRTISAGSDSQPLWVEGAPLRWDIWLITWTGAHWLWQEGIWSFLHWNRSPALVVLPTADCLLSHQGASMPTEGVQLLSADPGENTGQMVCVLWSSPASQMKKWIWCQLASRFLHRFMLTLNS